MYCIYISICVSSVEEVILADDENENDYDGMNCCTLFYYTKYILYIQ